MNINMILRTEEQRTESEGAGIRKLELKGSSHLVNILFLFGYMGI